MTLTGLSTDPLRQSTRLAVSACVLLAALALWLLVRLGLALWPRPPAADPAAPAVGNVPVAATPASLARLHLFGVTPLRPGSDAPGAPAATVGLILRGTLADKDPRVGVAMIDGAGGGERAFRVGDEVLPGVRLAAVHADSIELTRAGANETLRLVRDTNLDPANIVRPTPGSAKAAQTLTTPAPKAGAIPANIPAPVGVPAQQWQRTLERLRNDPAELMQRVQVVPVLDGGRLAGVRIHTSGADAQLLAQAGLQAGDVVTAVNGQRVDSLERGQQILATLGSAASVRVTVLRNGKPTDITVALK